MKEDKKVSKEVKKNNTKKNNTKKVVKKDVVRKPRPKKEIPNLNETITTDNTIKEEVVINNDNLVKCKYCHQEFEKGYTICPHCHRRQNTLGYTFIIIFGIVFLFGIICFHFVDKYIFKEVKEDYTETCTLVDYETLVRHPKDYRGKDVKVIGKVVSVDGYDTGFSNNMYITINANLSDSGEEKLITLSFNDNTYDQGFIKNDLITAFGKYESINGNTPNIDAKFIVFGR